MKFLVFFVGFFVFLAQGQKRNFFCDYLGTPFVDEGNHPNEYFNRMFFYKKISSESYQADFKQGLDHSPVLSQLKNNFLYYVYPPDKWGTLEVYRFHKIKKVLTKSWVYYIKSKNYDEYIRLFKKNYPYSPPFSQGPLEFVEGPPKFYSSIDIEGDGLRQSLPIDPKEDPKKYVKVGYDGTHWQCHEVAGIKYLFRYLGVAFMQIFGV